MLRNKKTPKLHFATKNGEYLGEIKELKNVTIDSTEIDDSNVGDYSLKPIDLEFEIKLSRPQRRRLERQLKKDEKRDFKKQKRLL
ncbi:hypothetical protein UT300003_32320 [Clostridium sardiniense]